MHINHIDIPVPDIAATRDFFVNQLGFAHVATLGQDRLAILKDDHGTVLVLSRAKNGSAPADGFHIGFLLESRDAVDAMNERLQTGLSCAAPRDMHGGYVFYFEAPGPILIEVGHRP
jgi:catechol 2,3-dioxygenase-like lactoylglutathione lyase family enzyme